MIFHIPVLLNEIIDSLKPNKDKVFIDGTLGHGGHTIDLLKNGATVYGIDEDTDNIKTAQNRIDSLKLQKKFIAINDNFKNIQKIIKKYKINQIDGIILDLGLSQNQLTEQNRGFSFNDSSSLDMRINIKKNKITAKQIVNQYSKEMLYDIFSKFSQEKLSRPIVSEIIKNRPISNGQQLSSIISSAYQKYHLKTKINPSTKIFLALKIAVNDEINNLKKFLKDSTKIIKTPSPICIISFHSTEDRIVKNFIKKNHFKETIIYPTKEEIKFNPLSRSAILRSFYPQHA